MAPSVKIDSTPQRALIIVPTVVLVFSTLAIGLRFYARQIKRQRFVIEVATGVICVCSSSVPVVYSRVSPRLGSYARNLLSSLRITTGQSQSSNGGGLGYVDLSASDANNVPSKQVNDSDVALVDMTV